MTNEPDEEDYQRWWEKTWGERHELLIGAFGETRPPGVVVSFSWKDWDLVIPGACAMVFPPDASNRFAWTVVSHGLAQPKAAVEAPTRGMDSGYGREFGFLTTGEAAWAPEALYWLLTYVRRNNASIERGHRVPLWSARRMDETLAPAIGAHEETDPPACGLMRWLLFWPHMKHLHGFTTSTGSFDILIGRTITASEWTWAKSTSSGHLLLLLFEAGIGQVSDLDRPCLSAEAKWQARWAEIAKLSDDVAGELLLRHATRR